MGNVGPPVQMVQLEIDQDVKGGRRMLDSSIEGCRPGVEQVGESEGKA